MEQNNELLIDQIMSYTIQAGDILERDFLVDKEPPLDYRYFLLPSGPEFYTGPLKAAGYLLLHPSIKKLIFIKKQQADPDHISIHTGADIVMLGQKIKTTSKKYPKTLIKTTTIDEEVEKQIMFVRLIKNIEEVVILGVGENISAIEIQDTIKAIEGEGEYGIIFFDTCSTDTAMNEGKKLDEYLVKHVLMLQQTKKMSQWLGNAFALTTKSHKHKPDVVGYFNSGDFGTNPSKSTGYVCIAA